MWTAQYVFPLLHATSTLTNQNKDTKILIILATLNKLQSIPLTAVIIIWEDCNT